MSSSKKQKPKNRKVNKVAKKKPTSQLSQLETTSIVVSETTSYVNRLIRSFVANVTDMIIYDDACKSVVFSQHVKPNAVEDFPSIKTNKNYIQSYRTCLNRLNNSIIMYANEVQFAIGGITIQDKHKTLKTSDIPEKNIWTVLNLNPTNETQLEIEGIDPTLSQVGISMSNIRIKENVVLLQTFKFMPKMNSWYQCPYIVELTPTFIEDFIAGVPLDFTLDHLFEDMELPSDDSITFDLINTIKFLIYLLGLTKHSDSPVIIPTTTETTPPKLMKQYYKKQIFNYFILQNKE